MITLVDRLRSAELEVQRLDISSLQDSLDKFVETISQTNLPDLVRLAHRQNPRTDGFFADFQAPFREDDPGLLLDGQDELGAALASGSLSQLFDSQSGESVTHAAAMLIRSATFLGWKAKAPELPSEAASHLQSLGAKKRIRQRIQPIALAHGSLDESLNGVSEAIAAGEMNTHLPEALTSLRDGARGLKDTVAKAVEVLNANQAKANEELDVCWWVMSGHSSTLQEPLSKCPKPAVPLIAGIELAKLIQFLPGPPAAQAFLATAMRPARLKATGTRLADAIGALPDEVSLELPDPLSAYPEFSPVAFALRRWRECGDDTWTSAFKVLTGLDAAATVKPPMLAAQAYNEALLAKAIGELDG